MTDTLPRRFITVAPPNVLSAIGELLRKAFGKPSPAEYFKIIGTLDRH